MSELPKGWVQCRLGDVLTLINGRAYNKDEMLSDPNSGVPILRIQNLNGGDNWFYSDSDLAEDKYCYKGDLLFAWSATFGPYWARWDKTIYHYHIWLIKPSTLLIKKFAFYVLQNITASIKAAAHGVAMPHMTKNGMENWSIGIPSPVQQTRIVEKLDEVLAQVDTIKARLDGIPAILKRFRQSVLAAAVSGRLTEEWRGNNDYLFNEDAKVDFPKSWSVKIIDDIADVKGGKRLPKGEELVSKDTGFPYIRAGQLKFGTVITGNEARNSQMYLLPHVQSQISRYIVSEGDAYITIVGASIGDAGTIPASHDGANLTENAAKICNFVSDYNSEFLGLWLRSEILQGLIKLEIKSGAQGKLALIRIKALPCPKPIFDEQQEIVRLVDQYFAFADTIEAQVKKAQARVDNLTQSILSKAFRGELVAQDPNDEPAEKLLERIAQARKEAEALAKAAKKVAKTK